ncbi:MAG TPA: hypothetical protein VFE53_03560 [Mucilaginibacter sp.]|jgi:hypothetical protein|nr:hypothetical protein [Mucilaginibacter sp.]
MKKLTGLILFVCVSLSALAQKQEKLLVQLTGIVHNNDITGSIVPYVNIVNVSDNGQVNQSNYKGYFSFVVHEQDTILFSCVGYNTIRVVIPSHVPSQSYTVQVAIKSQIANLPPFRVFPWATTEEFTKDFLSMKLADDDLEIARKNLNHNSIALMEQTLARDGSEINTASNFHNNIVRSHYYTNPLFNPFAWGNLINSISAGDKSRGVNGTSGSSSTPATTGN